MAMSLALTAGSILLRRTAVRMSACLLFVAGPAAAAEECLGVEPERAGVAFEVKQAGTSFRGKFGRVGGSVCFEAMAVTRVEVWLEPASVDSGLPEIDAAIKDKDFFAAAQYPRATYTSQSVEARGAGQVVHGTLDMKGRRRPLDVAFGIDGSPARRSVTGTLRINRLDWGIGTGEWANTQWLAGEVAVEFKAAFVRK